MYLANTSGQITFCYFPTLYKYVEQNIYKAVRSETNVLC